MIHLYEMALQAVQYILMLNLTHGRTFLSLFPRFQHANATCSHLFCDGHMLKVVLRCISQN